MNGSNGKLASDTRTRRPEPASTLTRAQRSSLRVAREIRERYADGAPLVGADHDAIMAMLRRHPHAARKIGPGVAGLTVHTFVGRTRCFFVIRTDGTAVDFSVRKCLGIPKGPRPAKIARAMALFRYAAVVARFRTLRTRRGVSA